MTVFGALVPVSGLRRDFVEDLAREIGRHLPEGERVFADADSGGMPLEFDLGERLREKLFVRLGEELPYGLGVVARDWRDNPKLLRDMKVG